MSLNTLETAYANGQVIDASHINELTLSLLGQFVGRDANGVPTPSQSLGTLAIPWGNLYATGIILNGFALDTSAITSLPNRVVSGKSRSLSSMPDYLRANGAALEFDILGASVDLVLAINNVATSISSDLNKTGIVAAPSTNNTALINDTDMVNDLYAGESDANIRDIIIDTVGSEIVSKVGQIVAFETPTGEIFQGLLKTSTLITNVFRGYYLDSSGNPIARGNLSNNDSITLLNIGWVFIEDNGTTIDVSTLTPAISYNAPNSPATGQYWFDITNQVWKRYSGTSFEIINRILIGQVVSDDTNTSASRSWDFSLPYHNDNNIDVEINTSEIVKSKSQSTRCNVYGTEILIDITKLIWNITTDLESPQLEASNTRYYLYLSDEGQEIISNIKPYVRYDLKGKYHPHHSWRCVGFFDNNASSDIDNSHGDSVIYTEVAHFQVQNGYGSTNTRIPKMASTLINQISRFAKLDFSNATLGFFYTALEDHLVNFSFMGTSGGSTDQYGVSLNSTTLTTNAANIASSTLVAYDIPASASQIAQTDVYQLIKKGETLRPHTSGQSINDMNIRITATEITKGI